MNKCLFFVCFFLFSCVGNLCFGKTDVRQFSLGKLVRHYGYPYENHTVLTDDGYYLTIGRIPYRNSTQCQQQRGVAILWHGAIVNAKTYVIAGPNQSLGFLMSQECYDIWLPNTRGTAYSSRHATLSTSQRAFWNYSLDETTSEDYPSVIQYIWQKTGRKKMHALGISMGAAQFVYLFARYPKYQELFTSLHLVAPAIFFRYVDADNVFGKSLPVNFIYDLTKYSPEFLAFSAVGNNYEFRTFTGELCNSKSSDLIKLCGIIVEQNRKINYGRHSLWPIISQAVSDRTSMKLMLHFGQMRMTGEPTMYSYGPETNKIKYGSETPPKYPLENVKVPTYIYHSRGDDFSDFEDNLLLESRLPNVKARYCVENVNFTHHDFVLSPYDLRQANDFILKYFKGN